MVYRKMLAVKEKPQKGDPSPLRAHFVRATVRVHEYRHRRQAVFHGPHRLADYDPAGNLCDDAKLAA